MRQDSYPVNRLGRRTFILLRICLAMVLTRETLPSLLWGAPVKMDLRVSASACHAVSSEFSEPTDPDCADAIATDCPTRATHSMSGRFFGPLFKRRAWTQAIVFVSPSAWSILLKIPIVLEPTASGKHDLPKNKVWCYYWRYFFQFKRQTIWINILRQPNSSRWCNFSCLYRRYHN